MNGIARKIRILRGDISVANKSEMQSMLKYTMAISLLSKYNNKNRLKAAKGNFSKKRKITS